MRDNIRLKQQPFELALGVKQVSAVVVAALVILGAVFALGLGVGRKSGGDPEQAPPALRDALARLDEPIAAKEEAPPELKAHQALTDSRSIEKTMPVPVVNASPKASEMLAPLAEERAAPEHEVVTPPAIAAMDPAVSPNPNPGLTLAPVADSPPATPDRVVQPPRRVAKETKPVPASTSRSADVRSRSRGKDVYTIQVASTQRRVDAERVAKRLVARRPRIVAADVPGKGRWYRVQIGSYGTRESARVALLSMAGIHGVVMPTR